MALFQTLGWDVPGVPIVGTTTTASKPSGSRKRKKSESMIDEDSKLPGSDINIDKLMKKMKIDEQKRKASLVKSGSSIMEDVQQKNNKAAAGPPERSTSKKRQRGRGGGEKRKLERTSSMMSVEEADGEKTEEETELESQSQQHTRSKRRKPAPLSPSVSKAAVIPPSNVAGPSHALSSPREESFVIPSVSDLASKKRSKKEKKKEKEAAQSSDAGPSTSVESAPASSNAKLTPMQRGMKQALEGGRFRYINEVLYKSDGKSAHQMLRSDPKIYDEYHAGFRQQVTSWPTNPVSHYVSLLSGYSKGAFIVDLGCGDATLAKSLIPKGFRVMSFDLVSDGVYVIEADICERLPLPGSDNGDGSIVDVVVCALSLMSINWLQCIREARRILKTGGELKIAEVTSRFTNADDFVTLVSSQGFELVYKGHPTTHFTLFDFKAVPWTNQVKPKDWKSLLKQGQDLLKPCEYKRR